MKERVNESKKNKLMNEKRINKKRIKNEIKK